MTFDMKQIEAGENSVTEFKREYTEDIKKTIVAFANTNGGTLYIGIDDNKAIIGVKDSDDTLLKVSNMVRSAIKPDLSLFVDYKVIKIQKTSIVEVTVQKGTSCPYYVSGKGVRPEGVYVRQGASSVPAADAVILNLIKETDGEKYEEIRSVNQELTFNSAKEFFKDKNIPFGINQQKTLKLQTNGGLFTNLGLLLSDQSIHTVKLAVFEGQEKEVFKDRQEFTGSLFKQLEEIYKYLDMYNHTFAKISGLVRNDRRDYPEEALRETLLNALVHRDYAFSSSILISIFDDRIEFVSIGGLVKGISLEDIKLGLSVLRNDNLANVFYRLRLIEAYGTGIPKIIQSYADCPRKPTLQATGNAFKIILPNRNVNIYEIPENNIFFTANEKTIISYLGDKEEIGRKDVEAALGVSQAMAVRHLHALVKKGAINVVGGGKNTRYIKPNTKS